MWSLRIHSKNNSLTTIPNISELPESREVRVVQEVPKKDVFVNKMTLDVLSSLIRVSRHKTQTYNSVQCDTTDEAIKCLSDYMQLTVGAGKRVWKLWLAEKIGARFFKPITNRINAKLTVFNQEKASSAAPSGHFVMYFYYFCNFSVGFHFSAMFWKVHFRKHRGFSWSVKLHYFFKFLHLL